MLPGVEGHQIELLPEYPAGEIAGVLPGDSGHLVRLPGDGPATYAPMALTALAGWRASCSCGAWRSELWRRTTDGAEDLAEQVVRASDAEIGGVPERAEVRAAVTAVWARDHLAAVRATAEVETAQRRVEAALLALDDAVAEARRRGVSWELIGRAAGVTRQSAHARWARRTTGGRHRSH